MSQTPSSSESRKSPGHDSANGSGTAASRSADALAVSSNGIDEEAWWYKLSTGAVEHGKVSPAQDRVGPFATQEAASHALDTLRENSARWAAEDAAEG